MFRQPNQAASGKKPAARKPKNSGSDDSEESSSDEESAIEPAAPIEAAQFGIRPSIALARQVADYRQARAAKAKAKAEGKAAKAAADGKESKADSKASAKAANEAEFEQIEAKLRAQGAVDDFVEMRPHDWDRGHVLLGKRVNMLILF